MQNYTQLQETASKLFVEMDYIAIASITISLIALIIAIASYSRTKKFQDYEYSPRIQILDEHITCGSPSLKDIPALSYRGEIENRGLKSVKVDSLYLDYGDKVDSNKRMRRHIDGELYLSPCQRHEFNIEISWADVEQMKKHFNINQCFFFFRVVYHTPDGSIQENTRPLGDARTMIILKGDCLT
ncbi:MAG: hypothetical protein GQ567_00335 [Methanosarcinales archaeon]|nr:hypothetical protein [Methanosarcinales archaeon]